MVLSGRWKWVTLIDALGISQLFDTICLSFFGTIYILHDSKWNQNSDTFLMTVKVVRRFARVNFRLDVRLSFIWDELPTYHHTMRLSIQSIFLFSLLLKVLPGGIAILDDDIYCPLPT